eukprot:3062359-Amphidinium_carterae.1
MAGNVPVGMGQRRRHWMHVMCKIRCIPSRIPRDLLAIPRQKNHSGAPASVWDELRTYIYMQKPAEISTFGTIKQ